MNLLRRIAAFFETRPTYEQIHEAFKPTPTSPLRTASPSNDDYEMIETTPHCWHVATMLHSVFSDVPQPEFNVIESNEFDFDPVSFKPVAKPPRMAYYIWRKKS